MGGRPAGETVCHERSVADGFLTAERTTRNDKVLAAPVPLGPRLTGYLRNQILIFLYRQFHIKGIVAVQGLKFKNAS